MNLSKLGQSRISNVFSDPLTKITLDKIFNCGKMKQLKIDQLGESNVETIVSTIFMDCKYVLDRITTANSYKLQVLK